MGLIHEELSINDDIDENLLQPGGISTDFR